MRIVKGRNGNWLFRDGCENCSALDYHYPKRVNSHSEDLITTEDLEEAIEFFEKQVKLCYELIEVIEKTPKG